MTILLALAGVLAGVLLWGLPGLLVGGVLGLLVGQQADLRKRLEKVEETQAQAGEVQAWVTELKVWARQTHDWLARLGTSAQPTETRPQAAAPRRAREQRSDPDMWLVDPEDPAVL